MPILEVKRLTKRFGDLIAVKNLTFEVEKGEVFGIAGPNGAGKTTLFNLISGFYSGTGEIFFKGEKISGLRPYQICHHGLVRSFQIPIVFATLTVYENVKIGANFGNDVRFKKEIIQETLDFIGLKGKENLKAKNLCLFDKKLLILAAALATKPRLLLLDEPIAGLNPVEIKQIVNLFKQINQELGLTIVVIEHLINVLIEISQRLMIMHNGEKICVGSPYDVVKNRKVIEVYLGADYA